MVGVGHSNFGLNLRSSESGVDVARAVPVFRLPQLREPTPHFSRSGERGGEGVEASQKCETKRKPAGGSKIRRGKSTSV